MIRTPFHNRTEAVCESLNWRNWAGYASAGKYELSHDREYYAIRNAAALIDVSPLYKYLVQGSDAEKFINRLITRNASKCKIGQVLYTTWCNDEGMVIDDGTVSRLGNDTFRITAAEPNLRWFEDTAFSMDVTITDISETLAALALQGPHARNILLDVVAEKEQLANLSYFYVMDATVNGRSLTISRTGYTGDLGYELWIPVADAEMVWDALIEAGTGYEITPAGILALDIARIEAGLLMIDVDYTPARHARIPSQKSSPFELDLGWSVDVKKPTNFNGRSALIAEKQNGSRWVTVGIEIDYLDLSAAFAKVNLPPAIPHEAWRSSVPIFGKTRRRRGSSQQIGYASSGCFSPILKRYIAIATIKPEFAAIGTEIRIQMNVEHTPLPIAAQVVKKPFFSPKRKTA
ncbi:MAG: aminomethyl transferase family protein [Aquificales bacterium]|nr:aminomethyl transferase family protein [Aquificales bacterium]